MCPSLIHPPLSIKNPKLLAARSDGSGNLSAHLLFKFSLPSGIDSLLRFSPADVSGRLLVIVPAAPLVSSAPAPPLPRVGTGGAWPSSVPNEVPSAGGAENGRNGSFCSRRGPSVKSRCGRASQPHEASSLASSRLPRPVGHGHGSWPTRHFSPLLSHARHMPSA